MKVHFNSLAYLIIGCLAIAARSEMNNAKETCIEQNDQNLSFHCLCGAKMPTVISAKIDIWHSFTSNRYGINTFMSGSCI